MPNSTLAQMGFLDEDTQQEAVYDLEDTQARSDISTINGKIPSTASSSNKMATASDITDINNKIPSNASSSNKLATISDVSAAYKPKGNATLATLPSLTAEHLNWVYNMTEDFTTTSDFAEGAGKSVKAGNEVGIIDVSTTSTPSYKYTVLGGFVDTSSLQPKTLDTPVEVGGVNRTTVEAVLGALANDKEDTILAATPLVKEYDEIMHQEVLRLNQDDAPTNNSNNPVKSGGIYTALADKASKANVIANTKLIKDTVGWSGKNKGQWINKSLGGDATIGYKLDNGGSSLIAKVKHNTSYTVSRKHGQGNRFRIIGFVNEPSSVASLSSEQLYSNNSADTYTVNSGSYNYLVFTYDSATTISQDTAEAMICDANILDPTYEPYFGSTAFPRSEQAVLGAKNLLDINKYRANGVTVTPSGNGLTIVGAAATAYPAAMFSSYPAGSYKVYLDVSNISLPSGNEGFVGLRKSNNAFAGAIHITENGHYEAVITTTEETTFQILPKSESTTEEGSVTVTNVMITLATDSDPTYAPYAMTNKELTDKAVHMLDFDLSKKVYSSGDYKDLNDVKTSGMYQVYTSALNKPSDIGPNLNGGILIVSNGNLTNTVLQTLITGDEARIYTRLYGNGSWGAWYKFQGTALS